MIQLRSAIEELGRLQVREDACWPAWSVDESLRETLDGTIRRRLLELAPAKGQKALLIGAGWPRLAVDLAERGVFVTVVDPDPERIATISRLAGQAGHLGRVTVTTDDYKSRAFEPSAFNFVAAWDSLERYTAVEPLIKKVLRELKAGGRLFVRARVKSQRSEREDLRRKLRAVLPLISGGDVSALAEDSFLMPTHGAVDRAELLEPIDRLLVVDEIRWHHRLASDLADVAVGALPALRGLVPLAQTLDERLLGRDDELARFVMITATKEKQLGRVFRPGG